MHSDSSARPWCEPVPPGLLSRDPRRWLAIFGPGAVLASLTIGVGELVFSARAGALFGYRLLWLFALVLALKWILVMGSARHILLTGVHPFQRWMDLPGPRGWIPLTFFLLAVPCFPIWICFHAGTLGTLVSSLTGTGESWRGGAHLVWGAGILAGTLMLSARGGYQALERVQLGIVLLMLGLVVVAMFFVHADWAAFLHGLTVPQTVAYPDWIGPGTYPDVASRPVWLETTTYLGVIGGSSYDYLAYASYLRDKRWGRAGLGATGAGELAGIDPRSAGELRRWLRAPLVDCTLSFAAVLVFTAVFVVCGASVLGPQHKVPAGSNLLSLQAEFLTVLHPWFRPVYFAGAFLAVLGTLYGTIEVAPAVLREMALAFRPAGAARLQPRLRSWSLAWMGAGGFVVLAWTLALHLNGKSNQAGLIAILTPANLFTGVLGCGLICLLNSWTDYRYLPRNWRPPASFTLLSLGAGLVFIAAGIVACWDHSRWTAARILAGTIAAGWCGAWLVRRRLG